MLRIAFVVPSLAPLGPVIVVRNLVERMVAHGHECVVFYFDDRENAMEFACETRKISFWKREDTSTRWVVVSVGCSDGSRWRSQPVMTEWPF